MTDPQLYIRLLTELNYYEPGLSAQMARMRLQDVLSELCTRTAAQWEVSEQVAYCRCEQAAFALVSERLAKQDAAAGAEAKER